MNQKKESALKPPIVLVHGAWHGSWAWNNWGPSLAGHGYNVDSVALYGEDCPRSGVRPYRNPDELSAGIETMVARQLRPPVVIAHSLSAVLVARLMRQGRINVSRIIYAAPIPMRPYSQLAITLKTIKSPMNFFRAAKSGRFGFDSPNEIRSWFFSSNTPEETIRETGQRLCAESFRMARDYYSPFLATAYSKVVVPTLVIGGENDAIFKPYMYRALAQRFGFDLCLIPGIGHDLMLDRDWYRALENVMSWINNGHCWSSK